MTIKPVIWQRDDLPGHDTCRLRQLENGFELAGASVLALEGQACRLDYAVRCDHSWVTHAAVVTGWIGDQEVHVRIGHDGSGNWTLNGAGHPEVEGCLDVDLNFSPSTNLLPIRRLELEVGQSASMKAAWLRFPGMELEVLEQTYSRLGESHYRYQSAGGFSADISVDPQGVVVDYGDFWTRVVG
jgi:hypothetical protein